MQLVNRITIKRKGNDGCYSEDVQANGDARVEENFKTIKSINCGRDILLPQICEFFVG